MESTWVSIERKSYMYAKKNLK
ncbi:hypothetical protein NC652_010733 [Populus alba x Populus x berolinensis]|nr:hypothetical protein NC652_010732 [Populus alba x Populus x berolinensis]KAJ6935795.1 hypothetical protein NC652_010733 [Populus alba x Populus x berolinensis]